MRLKFFVRIIFCFSIVGTNVAIEHNQGAIIILNGTSCAGKSTLSKKLQYALGKTSSILSSDDL